MIGNGCSRSETSSCGEWPDAASFLESSAGHELQFLYEHALVSQGMYRGVVDACSAPGVGKVSMRRDCFERVYTPPTPAELASDCSARNATDDDGRTYWSCFLPPGSPNPARACCAGLRDYESAAVMGTVNIYNVYGKCDSLGPSPDRNRSPRQLVGGDAHSFSAVRVATGGSATKRHFQSGRTQRYTQLQLPLSAFRFGLPLDGKHIRRRLGARRAGRAGSGGPRPQRLLRRPRRHDGLPELRRRARRSVSV